MEKLKVRINELNDLDENTLGNLLSDINVHGNGEKDDEVYELVDLFVKKVKNYLIDQIKAGSLNEENAIAEMKAVKKLTKRYIDITGIRKIYADNDFNNKALKGVQEVKANVFDKNKKGENVMNGVDGIKQRIDGFHEIDNIDGNTLESIVRGANGLNESQEKEEVYAKLTGKIWEVLSTELIAGKIDVTDFRNKVADYRDKLKTYAGFTDGQVDDLFKRHGLDMDPEALVKNNAQAQDASRMVNPGSNSSNSGNNNSSSTSSTSTGTSSNSDSSNNGSTANDGATTGDVNQEQSDEQKLSQEEIDKEVAELEAELADVFTAAEAAKMTPRDYLNAEIKKIEEEKSVEVKEINNKIQALREQTNEYKLEILENQSMQLEGYGVEADNPDLMEINSEIKLRKMSFDELNVEKDKMTSAKIAIISNYSSLMTDEEKKQLDVYKNTFARDWYTSAINDAQAKIGELETERSWMELSNEDDRIKEIDKELSDLHKKLDYYTKNKNGIDEFKKKSLADIAALINKYDKEISAEDKQKLADIDKKTKLIEECIVDKNNSVNNKQELDKLNKQLKEVQSQADKKVSNLKDKLDKLDKLDNLKGQRGKEKTEAPKEKKRYDLMYKALAGVAGFGLGFGMAMVPGIGTIRMELAIAKLAVSATNTAICAWTKRHPEGKVAKFIDARRAKREERQAEFRENHPKIAKAVDVARNVIRSPYTKWFTNGVALGYISGNIYEGVKNYMDSRVPTDQITATDDYPVKPDDPISPVITSTGFSVGDSGIDVSSIKEGFKDSFGNGRTHLMTELGKNVEIIGEQNGMYSLRSLVDGELYGWLPKDAVDALQTVANVAGKTR